MTFDLYLFWLYFPSNVFDILSHAVGPEAFQVEPEKKWTSTTQELLLHEHLIATRVPLNSLIL